MEKISKNKLANAREKLRKTLTIEKIRKIPKYMNLNAAQYLQLINNIECLAILMLEAYVFIKNDTI